MEFHIKKAPRNRRRWNSPRKNKKDGRRASKNLKGHKPGKVIRSPRRSPQTLDDIYDDDSPSRGNYNDNLVARPLTRHGEIFPTFDAPENDAPENDGNGSDGSRFSTAGHDGDEKRSQGGRDDDGEERRSRGGRRGDDHHKKKAGRRDDGHRHENKAEAKKRSQREREEEKRQRTIDELAKAQRERERESTMDELARAQREGDAAPRRKEETECISIDDDDCGDDNKGFFDGVRIDGVDNSANKHFVEDALLKVNQNLARDRGRGRGKKSRGAHHQRSALDRKSLSPRNNQDHNHSLHSRRPKDELVDSDDDVESVPRSPRAAGRRGNNSSRKGLTSYDDHDPLDEAQAKQESNRATRHHTTHVSHGRVVNGQVVNNSTIKRGKKLDVTKATGSIMDHLVASNSMKGGGQATSKKQYGNANMDSSRHRRKQNRCGGAAEGRASEQKTGSLTLAEGRSRRDCDPMEHEERGPSSGEKRKRSSKHNSRRLGETMGGHWPRKERHSPVGSQDEAIEVDSDHSDRSSSPRKGGEGEDKDAEQRKQRKDRPREDRLVLERRKAEESSSSSQDSAIDLDTKRGRGEESSGEGRHQAEEERRSQKSSHDAIEVDTDADDDPSKESLHDDDTSAGRREDEPRKGSPDSEESGGERQSEHQRKERHRSRGSHDDAIDLDETLDAADGQLEHSPRGSCDNAISVDIRVDAVGDSGSSRHAGGTDKKVVLSVEESMERKAYGMAHRIASPALCKIGEEEDDEILAAVTASLTPVNREDYTHMNADQNWEQGSAAWDDGQTKWDDRETKAALMELNGASNFGLRRAQGGRESGRKNSSHKKGRINDSANKKGGVSVRDYLRGCAKRDNLLDASTPNPKAGLRESSFKSNVDSSSDVTSRPIPRKTRYGKVVRSGRSRDSLARACMDEPESDGWLTTGKADVLNNGRNRQKSGMLEKLKKAGGVLEEEKRGEPEFCDGSMSRSSPSRKDRKPRKKHQGKLIVGPTSSRRSTRSSARHALKPHGGSGSEIITIDDSSSSSEDEGEGEGEGSTEDAPPEESIAESRVRRRAAGDRFFVDAVRIAVGMKVFKKKCELSFQPGTNNPYILFSYNDAEGKKNEHCVYLKDDELKEVKYFIASEDECSEDDADGVMTVISFRITPTGKNNFVKYSKSYHQEESDDMKSYISVEVRDTNDLMALLAQMREHDNLELWCGEGSKIPSCDLAKYTRALREDNEKETRKRLGSARKTNAKKDCDNPLLLVYPFDAQEAILNKAALGLKELGGDMLGVDKSEDDRHRQSSSEEDGNGAAGKTSTRTHYITIRQDDKDRLCPGQFLNDSLVDFWMRWISRGESKQDSDVHFFTSHFMTTLKDDGPEAVSSWTAKKKINVFKKKLIFAPVNADLHWSLCVIVNPGLIANSFYNDVDPGEEHSCILFLDSLKMHSKLTYAKHIRTWLNFEWKRLGKRGVEREDAPFSREMMLLCSPKIPYQENGCDCGVFVCRYAYNLYKMRHLKFTWNDIDTRYPFRELITWGPAFDFDMNDIARIREEIEMLIDNLSRLYLRMKEQEKANKRTKRREIESSKTNNQSGSSEIAHGEDANEEATSASSEKENARSETTTMTSDQDGGTADGTIAEEGTSTMSGKEDAHLEPSAMALDEDGGMADGSTAGAAVSMDEDGDAISASSEMKENISHQNAGFQESHAHDVAALDKSASTENGNADSDILKTEDNGLFPKDPFALNPTTLATDEYGSPPEESMTAAAAVAKDEDGDVIMASSEEKENISQQELGSQDIGICENAALDKLASSQHGNAMTDIAKTQDEVDTGWALDI